MYKNIICFFSFPFITRNTDVRYESSVNCFLSVLVLRHWYRATSKHRIVLVSPRFSTFVSLIHLSFYSPSQPFAVKRKAVMWHFVIVFCGLLSIYRVKIFSGLYNFPDAHAINVITPPTYLLHMNTPPSTFPSTQFTCHIRRSPRPHHIWRTCVLYTLGNRYTSCCFTASSIRPFKHATYTIFARSLLGHPCSVYFGQQVLLLLYHPRN